MAMRRAFSAILPFFLLTSHGLALQGPPHLSPTPSIQRLQALDLEKQGNLQQAEQAWRTILKTQPRNAEAYAHLGLLAARRGSYKEAIPLDRKALALGPDLSGLRMNLGLALFKSGQPKEAIREFSRLLNAPGVSSEDALRARILIGMAHYGQGEYADAIPFLKAAAAADTTNLPLRLILAHSCLWTHQNECVLDTYREILTISPDSAEAYILAGEAMDAMKNTTGAIEQFRLAIRANPRQPLSHFALGYLLWTQSSYDEAAKELHAELEVNPDYPQALLFLADIDVKANRFAEAAPVLARVEKADPSLAMAHLDMGIVEAESGHTDAAIKELKEAAILDPTDADSHWRLARLYRSRGDTEAAEKELAKTKELKTAAHQELYEKLAHGHPQQPSSEIPFTPSKPSQ